MTCALALLDICDLKSLFFNEPSRVPRMFTPTLRFFRLTLCVPSDLCLFGVSREMNEEFIASQIRDDCDALSGE